MAVEKVGNSHQYEQITKDIKIELVGGRLENHTLGVFSEDEKNVVMVF